MPLDRSEAERALLRIAGGETAGALETDTLDFKEERGSPAEVERLLAEAAICFANAAGGIIVLGVSDKLRGEAAFTGATIDPGRIRQRIFELSRPPLLVELERYSRNPSILLIHVPQSVDIHSDTQGRAYRRIHRDCLPMDPRQQERLREERRGIDWSAMPSGQPTSAASPDAIRAAKSLLLNLNDERRTLAGTSEPDLFSALGVLSDRSTFNRAGALMFCNGPTEGGDGVVYQYRPTPGGEPQLIERLGAPAILGFGRVLELIRARQSLTPVTLPNGQQIHIENFPSLAIREALSNAMCHRDYHLGAPISIEHSPEIFIVTSPGPLVSGVTPQNILTVPSRPRNPALAKAARILGLAEETGRGVDRMYREMIRSGRGVPQIASDFEAVRVVLAGSAPDTNIARFIAGLPDVEREDTDTMLILYRLCTARTLSATQAAPLLQKTPEEAEVVLRRLATDGVALLEATRQTRGRSSPTYRLRSDPIKQLGSAILYNRRSTTETDRKIVAHVREYGKITNRTLQNLFDVGVFKARDIIAGLVARGILVRVSQQARGPGVEWGPGPGFPARKQRASKAPANFDPQGSLL
jgi:ATP-dependent DNA helicase RecG